ncbi:MAG: hypothetical protein H5T44_04640 [Thermoplasmatales archaeon]|nr:hypothetical protein [Thermoplasmatales archaeon]
MEELKIAELEDRKKELKKKMEEAKNLRDILNKKLSELRKKNNELKDELKRKKKEASLHKKMRDEINKEVAMAKKRREELNKQYGEIRDKLGELQKKFFSDGVSLDVLYKKRDALEFKQMTRALKRKEEEELIEKLASINKEIMERENALRNNQEFKKYLEMEKELKEESDKEHERVRELAGRAQAEHEKMLQCLSEAREILNEIKKIEEEYIITKINADKAHNEFLNYLNSIKGIEKMIEGKEEKEKGKKIEKEKDVLIKKAEELYDKFKKGEKLSTEDLLLLQRVGLI